MTPTERKDLVDQVLAASQADFRAMVDRLVGQFCSAASMALDEAIKLIHLTAEHGLSPYAKKVVGQLAEAVESLKRDLAVRTDPKDN